MYIYIYICYIYIYIYIYTYIYILTVTARFVLLALRIALVRAVAVRRPILAADYFPGILDHQENQAVSWLVSSHTSVQCLHTHTLGYPDTELEHKRDRTAVGIMLITVFSMGKTYCS
jgi:hypothetical protein